MRADFWVRVGKRRRQLPRSTTTSQRATRPPSFSPQVGGKELKVVVRGQRVQLLLQLLLGEAGRKPPDHHLRRGRTVGLASPPALPSLERRLCLGSEGAQKRPRCTGDTARPSEGAAPNTAPFSGTPTTVGTTRTVRARVENSNLTSPRWAPAAPDRHPAADRSVSALIPDRKHHRLQAGRETAPAWPLSAVLKRPAPAPRSQNTPPAASPRPLHPKP